MTFVGAVGVGVQEIECEGGVRRGFVGEDFEVVVAYPVDGCGTLGTEAEGERLGQLH